MVPSVIYPHRKSNNIPTRGAILLILLKICRVPRFLISIVSCRIILHIRKYGHEERRASDMNSAIDMGETLEALSRLHFRSPGRTLGVDSDLESP